MRELRLAAVVLALAGCGQRDASPSASAPPPPQRPAPPLDASRDAFVRVDKALVTGFFGQAWAAGETVGHMELLGEFLCRLEARFGRGELETPLADGPPKLGFPLRHVASNTLIVPFVDGSMGYAGASELDLKPIAAELDALLATTPPIACEYTFPEYRRVDRAGVRDGQPFFEHLGIADTLEFRLAQFAYNDEHGGQRTKQIERELCHAAIRNWSERTHAMGSGTKGALAANPRGIDAFTGHGELQARLVRCIERELAQHEADIASDAFYGEATPGELTALAAAYQDVVGTGPLTERIRAARKTAARGHTR